MMPLDEALSIFDNNNFMASFASADFFSVNRVSNFLTSVFSSVLSVTFLVCLFLDFLRSLNEALFIGILVYLPFVSFEL